MNTTLLLAPACTILGGVFYVVTACAQHPKLCELARITFACGLLVSLAVFAGRELHLSF